MKITTLLLPVALWVNLVSPMAQSQNQPTPQTPQAIPNPAFDFHAVVRPGMTIGGHTFTLNTTIQSITLNDAGEVAFIARWTDAGTEHAAVFASDRIVATEGNVIELNRIGAITRDCTVAINNSGQIAYSIVYSDSPLDLWMENARWGIFVDKHLVFSSKEKRAPAFTFTDGGRVISTTSGQWADLSSVSPAPNPITDAPINKTDAQPPTFHPRPSLADPASLFPMLRMNARGQVLIPVNLNPSGFVLLLGTPITH